MRQISSCGKSLMELYEWGWIKKIPRIAVINADGANTLNILYNGKFEEKVVLCFPKTLTSLEISVKRAEVFPL